MQCRICGSELHNPEKSAVSCMRCSAAFHRDCWAFNGRCGIYGCGCETYTGFRESQTTELVEIDDSTRAPIDFTPYVEALAKKLPAWGRRIIPVTTLGVTGSIIVSALYFTFINMPFDMTMQLIFLGMGFFYSIISVPLGSLIRRNPEKVAITSGIVATIFYNLSRRAFHTERALLVATAVTAGMMLCNGLAERLTAPYRLNRSPGPLVLGIIRAFMTAGFLFAFLCLLTVISGPWPLGQYIFEIAIVSLLGLVVAAPPLEASKMALLKRLEAGDDSE